MVRWNIVCEDVHEWWGVDGHVRTFPHVPRIRNTRNCPVRSKELSGPREHPSSVAL